MEFHWPAMAAGPTVARHTVQLKSETVPPVNSRGLPDSAEHQPQQAQHHRIFYKLTKGRADSDVDNMPFKSPRTTPAAGSVQQLPARAPKALGEKQHLARLRAALAQRHHLLKHRGESCDLIVYLSNRVLIAASEEGRSPLLHRKPS